MRQPFFDDQPESELVTDLGQEICNNDRFASAGHPKQDTMLRRVPEPCSDPDQVPSGSIVNCFGPVEVTGKGRRPRDNIIPGATA
jgi:hypothetical protein